MNEGRFSEWYVLHHGPRWLQILSGLSFWPYTIMGSCLPVIAGLFAPSVRWGREIGIFVIWLIGLGLSSHALDALGKSRPWGVYLGRKQLWGIAAGGFSACIAIGFYFIASQGTWILLPFGAVAIFLSVGYNLELFRASLHRDAVVCFAWGSWSVATGYLFNQGNNLLVLALLMIMGYSVCSVEINASRPYRALKGGKPLSVTEQYRRYEKVLMSIVALIISLTTLMIVSQAFPA